jgi:hypothetical protein
MTKEQIDALENLDRAGARLTAAQRELKEATADHNKALTMARTKVPNLFATKESTDDD